MALLAGEETVLPGLADKPAVVQPAPDVAADGVEMPVVADAAVVLLVVAEVPLVRRAMPRLALQKRSRTSGTTCA